MIKKLRQIGNSWGMVFPKAILDLLKINPILDEIEFRVIDDEIRIKKHKK